MKALVAMSIGIFACSNTAFADGINSSLSFLHEERIALGSGNSGSGWYFTPHVGVNMISNTATEGFTIKFDNGISFGGGFVQFRPLARKLQPPEVAHLGGPCGAHPYVHIPS